MAEYNCYAACSFGLEFAVASELKNMGFETYVFSKRNKTIGEKECTKVYDVDVLDVDEILEKCENLKIDGITSMSLIHI